MEVEKGEPSSQEGTLPQRNRFEFSEPREPHIWLSSQFDSGNMLRAVRTAHDHYSLWTACDAQGTDNEGYPKSWFYFRAGGFLNRKVSFSVHRVHFLYAMVTAYLPRPNATTSTAPSAASTIKTVTSEIGNDCRTLSLALPSTTRRNWSSSLTSCSPRM